MQEKIKMENYKETIRLMEWLSENPAIREAICSEDEPNPEECLQIITKLGSEAFYDMVLIFMLRQNHRWFMSKVCNTIVMDELIKAWEEKEPDEMCQRIEQLLRETIDKSDERMVNRTDDLSGGMRE